MATYTEVTPDVLSIAHDIISRYHPALLDARIGFIFQDEASAKMGKTVLGNAAKVSDKQRAVGLDLDYIITLARDEWLALSTHQRKALIDHELCHCDFTYGSVGVIKMRGHDIEEFKCIIERYGLWKPDLQEFGEAVSQAILPGLLPLKRAGAVLAVEPQMAMAEAGL